MCTCARVNTFVRLSDDIAIDVEVDVVVASKGKSISLHDVIIVVVRSKIVGGKVRYHYMSRL